MNDDPKARIQSVLSEHAAREVKAKEELEAKDRERVSGFGEFSRVRASVIKPALLALVPEIEKTGYTATYEGTEASKPGGGAYPVASAKFVLKSSHGSDHVVPTLLFNNHGSAHVGTYEEIRGPGSQRSDSSGKFSSALTDLTQEMVQGAVAVFVEGVTRQLRPPRV